VNCSGAGCSCESRRACRLGAPGKTRRMGKNGRIDRKYQSQIGVAGYGKPRYTKGSI
jgi:hypothetical protein